MIDPTPLLQEANTLREGTPIALTLTASEMVQEQLQIRKEFKMKLREAKNRIDDEISDLEAWKRTLNIALGYQTTDIDKLQSYFWTVLHDEKEATR